MNAHWRTHSSIPDAPLHLAHDGGDVPMITRAAWSLEVEMALRARRDRFVLGAWLLAMAGACVGVVALVWGR